MTYKPLKISLLEQAGTKPSLKAMRLPKTGIKQSDEKLAKQLIKQGTSHAKFSRGIIFYIEVEMQVGFFIELETYRLGRTVLSTSSTMHNELKHLRGKELAEAKQAGLESKVYTQIAMYSAQCLRKIWIERRKHKLPDWGIFCDFIEELDRIYGHVL